MNDGNIIERIKGKKERRIVTQGGGFKKRRCVDQVFTLKSTTEVYLDLGLPEGHSGEQCLRGKVGGRELCVIFMDLEEV